MNPPATARQVVEALWAARSAEELPKVRRRLADDEETFGLRMGELFAIAKRASDLDLREVHRLLDHPAYEPRMAAVCILDFQARRRLAGDPDPTVHKPVGIFLKHASTRDPSRVLHFLDDHAAAMARAPATSRFHGHLLSRTRRVGVRWSATGRRPPAGRGTSRGRPVTAGTGERRHDGMSDQ